MSAERVVIRAAYLFDGTGGVPVRAPAIVVRDGTIETVAKDGRPLPQGPPPAREYEFDGAWVVPGLVDAHSHVILPGDGTPFKDAMDVPNDVLLLRAARNVGLALREGVTTLQDNGARGLIGFTMRDAIAQGLADGPRLVVCGRALTITGGHCWYFGGEADGPEGVRRAVRQLIKEGADYIKVMATGGGTVGTNPYAPSYSLEELKAIVAEARALGRRTAVHCTAIAGIANALDAGFDMLIHCTFHQPDGVFKFDTRLAERVARSGRPVNPTLHVARSHIWHLEKRKADLTAEERALLDRRRYQYEKRVDSVGRLHRMGVPIAAGSDAGWSVYAFGDFVLELESLTTAGLSARDALLSGTSVAARALRMDHLVGTVQPGKAADLVIVDGDPTKDIMVLRRPRAIFKGGRPVVPSAQDASVSWVARRKAAGEQGGRGAERSAARPSARRKDRR